MWKRDFPMAHSQDDSSGSTRQFHHRSRHCLLKGCERIFYPQDARTRYCSEECRVIARQWVETRARERYCRSEKGRQCRREQSKRYRRRCQERSNCGKNGDCCASEGDPQKENPGVLCDRPGCFVRVMSKPRSPLQKYCSFLCARALRRVYQREQHWHKRMSSVTTSLPQDNRRILCPDMPFL